MSTDTRYFFRITCVCAVVVTVAASGCGLIARGTVNAYERVSAGALTNPGRISPLTKDETAWAQTAWRYITNNTDVNTGLVSGLDRQSTTSLWQIGDYLAALIAARELDLIKPIEFDHRLVKLLGFLNKMPLLPNGLPNKFYDTHSGAMVNSANQPGAEGVSAIDVGRLLVWLKLTGERYPEYSEYLDRVVLRWNVCKLIDAHGRLRSIRFNGKQFVSYREGRFGYEQYASAGFALWGASVAGFNATPLRQVYVSGVPVVVDARDERVRNEQANGKVNALTSLPYLLFGIEFSWRSLILPHGDQKIPDMGQQADSIYAAQMARWRNEKIITARTDYQRNDPPYFVYDTIFGNGYPWNVLDDQAKSYPDLALVSTRATFGLWVLWNTQYTDALMNTMGLSYEPERGWYEGRYEKTGAYEATFTLSTNATVLEALLYKNSGPMASRDRRLGYFDAQLADPFTNYGACFNARAATVQGF